MKIFITGASGYIGGSLAATLLAAGHRVSGLARSVDTAAALEKLGIAPLRGTLDDADVLGKAARAAEVTVNAASADHRAATEAMLTALAGTGKTFLHTSGSSIVGSRARRHRHYGQDRGGRGCPDNRDRTEPDLRVRARSQSTQHPGAVADHAGEEIRRGQAYWPGREPLVERAYRRSGDGLHFGDREGACGCVLFRRERRKLHARSVPSISRMLAWAGARGA